jgi:hypothetical protein
MIDLYPLLRYRGDKDMLHYLEKQVNPRLDRVTILAIKDKKLDPYEFCKKYCTIPPDDRGFKAQAIRELMALTGCSERTVEKWGVDFKDAPQYVFRLCQKEDILREIIKQTLRNNS